MLPAGVDFRAATEAAERLRGDIENMQTIGELRIPLSVTIGVAAFPDDATAATDLVEIADRRLYAGKKAGRNRVVSTG